MNTQTNSAHSPGRISSGEIHVATNLAVLSPQTSLEDTPFDLPHRGLVYRRLDPAYYAWLRHRMQAAKLANETGRLPSPAFEELRYRFRRVHAWAVERFGLETLGAAVADHKQRAYQPPGAKPGRVVEPMSGHVWPPEGEWRFTKPVPKSSVDMLEKVRDQCLALGWTEAGLYQNRGRFLFPLGRDYGLVCFLKSDWTIGRITRRYIELIGPPPRSVMQHFYNNDADQPWRRAGPNLSAPQDIVAEG